MAGIGNYGAGSYKIRREVSNHFGALEVQTSAFENAEEAIAAFEEWRKEDGKLIGTCPPQYRKTTRNRALREEMEARKR